MKCQMRVKQKDNGKEREKCKTKIDKGSMD